MPGYFRIEIGSASPRTSTPDAEAGLYIFLLPGARLLSDTEPLDLGGQACLVGHLFERGASSRRVRALDAKAREKIGATDGRMLVSSYWGAYAAILPRGDGALAIFRDPSGLLPVYYRADDTGITVSSDAGDLGRRGGVDYREIIRFLVSGGAPSRETCLEGVRLLLPGECLVASHGSHCLESWWSPWDWTQMPQRRFDAAARTLRTVALDCIESWASCFDSILVGVSGGLDSSIVAAAAARRAAALQCLTMVEEDAIGDERRYASILTEAIGVPLSDLRYDLGAVDIARAVAPHHPWPHAPLYMQAIASAHGIFRANCPVDAFFSGNGGDNIFCALRSASPFVDRFMAQGSGRGLFETLRDLSDLTGVSAATILRHAWDRYLGRHHPPRLHRDYSGLSTAAIAEADAAVPSHPWMKAPETMFPGKAAHVRLLARAQRSIELYSRRTNPQHIAPLLSQPIVETCLSIPTWQWVEGGRDRAVARAAFKSIVPAPLLRRTSKGGPGGFMQRIFQANVDQAADMLRGGRLAQAGLLDLTIFEGSAQPTLEGSEKAQRILALCAAESWVSWWTDCAPPR